MGRRRWRFFTITAFLLFIIKDTQCQDENDFYYTPVERSFAQVQPPLFPNSRPSTFFEHGDNYRTQPAQQPLYNEGHVRFPSPNYNQNPSPFQLPTGRSQSGTQYYVNQPEFSGPPPPQRQRFRPALPYNFQMIHPASTKRPDVSQIHSVAYQNDPSKPETFLGQITINNPDIDYLRNSRFKNIPFDNNSLKSNGQSGHISHDEDIDNENQDLFEHHRVTTYNPGRLPSKSRLNTKPKISSFHHYDSVTLDDKTNLHTTQNKPFTRNNAESIKPDSKLYHSSSTEYKALLDLEPLLEDDISDISSFRELMKNKQGSFDVEVIKSNHSYSEIEAAADNKPDASSMNSDNISKDMPPHVKLSGTTSLPVSKTSTTVKPTENDNVNDDLESHEVEEGEEYEYYEDSEDSEVKHTTQHPQTTVHTSDIYDEYDSTEEPDKPDSEVKSNVTEPFDILITKPVNTMVKDDNFKQFVDTPLIDQMEKISNKTNFSNVPISGEDISSVEQPSILGQEVVSVVTTKSVVNGTISIPDITFAPTTTKINVTPEPITSQNKQSKDFTSTTENVIVVASVQTSRSVSGARFLPFPAVGQEGKKQVLTNDQLDEEEELVTKDPMSDLSDLVSSSSTENINDKLDSIQSELSSAVLSGSLDNDNKNIELITESSTELTTSTTTTTTTTTTPSSLNVFTLKSTQSTLSTDRSSPDPLPVMIKKFTPRITTSTTPKPKKKLVTVMDDLAGLLPPGYKSRMSYKDKRTSTTTTTTIPTSTIATTSIPISSTEDIINGTQGRSSGINTKNRVIVLDGKSLLPKEYRPKEHKTQEDLLVKLQKDDLSKFLPPGYKPPHSDTRESKDVTKPDIIDKAQKIDISAFLPKGYNLNSTATTTTEKSIDKPKLPANAVPVDISAFLPPGFKLNTSEKGNDELTKFKVADVSSLLPPGFKINSSEEVISPSSTTKAPGGIKLVFPSRPGSKTSRKTTPKPSGGLGPSPVTPKIQKGWPTRASTEFTGWPSPSTTPFSIEKLLEAQRNATATSPMPDYSTEPTTRRVTTTTTTTPKPPPSTTPGVCRKECDIAATIKIVAGVKWLPELLDRHTEEWQRLANDVKDELNSVYSKSDYLKKWYKNIRIDGFSPGSVLVDYFIELNDVDERVDTLDLKKMFHKSLHEAKPGSVVEEVTDEPKEEFDSDMMLGDQPDEERMRKSNEKMTKTIDKSVGKLEIGKFVMDPAYTEFIVLPKREEPTPVQPEEESFLPQWGIAVIVIALASLLFVVIFGVTVLVNRQKSAKAKAPIPLSEDMLRELDKSHMGGFDDMHQLKERELPYLPSGKRMSTAFIEQLAYPNPGDSWRSEWTPQLQKYMQHYTPDSGRGSQIYGPVGNGYGYGGGGSQLYGQTGGGSQVYGYTGEYPRSHYGRRRSDYDSNF
ncbi:putative mediator of RNA polymerase II transcription subunit 26 [Galleria mellonella]|uniref:Mediator of RNA polymerase II transcription subunit 26 n=1 Tax=Galleria mellonella TaxID=7137 RepID=A0A6J1X8K1_GALME|nr:putative mediator of RNA polymerase II transcription subunit 26 [Galleria mellonella]